MKINYFGLVLIFGLLIISCGQEEEKSAGGGMASVDNANSQNDIVKVAAGSKDHTTLVAAVKAAELLDTLANPGPFTVFAPTNAAFDALPKGTVDSLLKPDKKDALADILEHHVAVGVFENLQDGQTLSMVSGPSITIKVMNGKPVVGGANILASVRASNGIVHVIDKVLVPSN